MKVVLITGHSADQPRKTGFHFWASILAERGIDVDFVTVGVSCLSFFKRNRNLPKPPFNEWVSVTDKIRKFIWMPIIHPIYLKNKISSFVAWPLFTLYPHMLPSSLQKSLLKTDVFIIENGCGTMLVPHLHRLNPDAKFIYNYSDSFSIIKFHPVVIKSHFSALPFFDLIRLNSSYFKKDFPAATETHYIPQSIDKSSFDKDTKNPYQSSKNVISVGDMIFDRDSVKNLAQAFPDWNFHLFGTGAKLSHQYKNVFEYGEVRFENIVPYMKYADIALAPYQDLPDAEYLGESSLKLVQYNYCKLPIVAPYFAASGRSHVLPYFQGKIGQNIQDAFIKAQSYDRQTIKTDDIRDWKDVIDLMLSLPKKEEKPSH